MHQLAAPGAVRPCVVAGVPKRRVGRDRRPHAGVLVRARDRRRATGRRRSEGSTTRSPSTTTTRSGAHSTTILASALLCRHGRRVGDQQFGEGRYDPTRARHPAAARRQRVLVSSKGSGLRRRPTGTTCARPRRISATGVPTDSPSSDRAALNERRAYERPSVCASTSGPSPATGRSAARMSCRPRPAEASPFGSTRATRISSSRAERASRFPSACFSTARLRAPHTAGTSNKDGNGMLRDGRLYQLVRQHDAVREQDAAVSRPKPGAEAYVFTFG